jgi:Asp-tRNA(Asn)/Glu-tRNA(Gln) amidotransferase A subunit family amidase
LQGFRDYLARREPVLQAFVPEEGRMERLTTEMTDLFDLYPDPDERPPLFGVLVGVKDIFHVDRFPTSAGSRLPPEELAGAESAAVAALKAAGALVAGKTHTTEFAYFAPGPTRNPHNPDHTPGGSSSGSAAAVAAGACPLALGTQTIGSIIRPAAYCGVVGYKPSYDRISRGGVIPLAPSVDHVGFFAANVDWAVRAAGVLCRAWSPVAVQGRKPVLGVPEGPYLQRVSPEGLACFREACERLAQSGYQVRSVAAFEDFDAICERHNLIVAAEAARVHKKWYAQYGPRYHPRTAELIERGQGVPEVALARDLLGRSVLRDRLETRMARHGIDLWVSPAATGPAPRGLGSTGDPVMNLPWTYAGLPALNLPAGKTPAGLPIGLQIAARWYQDEALLVWGSEMERALAWE